MTPLPEEWEILRSWLPEDLNGLAKQCQFLRRARGLTDSERWLRLILMHVAGGLSLEQTSVRARELGLAHISGVALFKRLRQAEAWLRSLCQHLLTEQRSLLGRCDWPSQYRVRAIDATDIQEPGSTGSAWRMHYSLVLPELVCDHYELTDQHGGESLGRFEFQGQGGGPSGRGGNSGIGPIHFGAHVLAGGFHSQPGSSTLSWPLAGGIGLQAAQELDGRRACAQDQRPIGPGLDASQDTDGLAPGAIAAGGQDFFPLGIPLA